VGWWPFTLLSDRLLSEVPDQPKPNPYLWSAAMDFGREPAHGERAIWYGHCRDAVRAEGLRDLMEAEWPRNVPLDRAPYTVAAADRDVRIENGNDGHVVILPHPQQTVARNPKGSKGATGMSYNAQVERSEVFGHGGFVLRMTRQDGPIRAQLETMSWSKLEDGDLCSYALGSNDMGGDSGAFLQSLMDASWRAGIRPSSLGQDETRADRIISAQGAHITDLRSQVSSLTDMLNKLIAK
jgi:hypothetical protein